MRTRRLPRRILAVTLTVLAAGLVTAGTADAGGWAETVLDPPVPRVEAGTTYTFGYWVLQHGSYPMRIGDLGPTALTATDQHGTVVEFPGTELPTRAHYSAEAVFPHDGKWRIAAQHGQLMPDEDVATVVVPGRVTVSPSTVATRADHEWGPVRPSFPPTAPDASMGAVAPEEEVEVKPLVDPAPAAREPVREPEDRPGASLPVWVVVGAGLGTVGFAFWLTRRRDARTPR